MKDSDLVFMLTIGAAALAVIVCASWWCFRHWSRIWRTPQTAYENVVFRQGARGWGLMMWLAVGVLFPLYDAVRAHDSWRAIVAEIGFKAVIEVPIYLWLGYWWGRGMAAAFGVKDATRAV